LLLPADKFNEAQMYAVRSLRGQVPMYIKGEVGAAQAREKLTRCSTLEDMQDELSKFRAQLLTAV
jgi:hypothetical protein